MKLKSIVDSLASQFSDCRFEIATGYIDVEYIDIGGMETDQQRGVLLYLDEIPDNDIGLAAQNCCLCTTENYRGGKNCIVAPDRRRALALFHAIQQIFARSHRIGELAAETLHRPMTLQEIVDRATEIMENPVLVVDLGHKILAISDTEVEDYDWRGFRTRGYITVEAEQRESFRLFVENAKKGRFVDVIGERGKETPSIRCALLCGNNLIGELRISACLRAFTPADIELTNMLGSLISVELMRHTIPFTVSTTGDYLVLDLIKGELTDERNINDRLRFVNWAPKRYKYLFMVDWEQPEIGLEQMDSCMSSLAAIVGNAHSVLHENTMVFLFDQDQELDIRSPLMHQIRSYLESIHLVGVLSMPFEQMSEAAYRYEQTKTVMRLNREINREDCFQQVEASSFELMLDQAGQKYDLFDYCHPLVRRLLNYDEKHGTDHCKFLEAYIFSGRSYSKAAGLLYTHRNTVIYRIKHIEELLGFSFSSEEYVFHIELSFRMLRYMQAVKDAKLPRKKEFSPTFY